jgi:hypothetical protein
MLVVVVFTPTGTAFPPPLVSFVAVQAGGFSGAAENVRVHVVTPVPSVTLPAESDPTMAAPVPQSGPGAGEAANEAADQHSIAAPASRTGITPLVLDEYRRMFTAPALARL